MVGPSREDDGATPQELYAIYVRAAWWGTGLGQALWDAVRPDAACSLWVLEDNARAQAFYRRNGFVPDGARELYAGLDAWEIRMVRSTTPRDRTAAPAGRLGSSDTRSRGGTG